MKNNRLGKIDIGALNAPPEKHEYETAKYFAKRNLDVCFIGPHYLEGIHNPDFLMCGKLWETKSPITYGKSSFTNNLKTAIKQSDNIIYDLRRLNAKEERTYMKELQKWSKLRKIKILLVITRDGQLLTIKGEFGNI